jgi:DNA (cytosine-5)-methyltransferase 1
MRAYYNESDPKVAAWLDQLRRDGHIMDGVVDTRPIQEVEPDDVRGFKRAHFFAGIAGWARALHLSGHEYDPRTIWTGSCPCQPFSNAGTRKGAGDERHLWPTWFRLIRECRPNVVFGEQVAQAVTYGWLDAVSDDMEGEGYAVGATVLPACSVGAPHQRQRLWFVAHADADRVREHVGELSRHEGEHEERLAHCDHVATPCGAGSMAEPEPFRLEGQQQDRAAPAPAQRKGAAGSWAGGRLAECADGKFRPIEPGILPLADGIPARVVRIRAYGNAIVPELGSAFIQEAFACLPM